MAAKAMSAARQAEVAVSAEILALKSRVKTLEAEGAADIKKIAAAVHERIDGLEARIESFGWTEFTVVHGWAEKHVGILCLAVAVAFLCVGIGIGTHFGS